MSKYNNKKCLFGGHKFDSIKERDRYIVLLQMFNNKKIKDLTLQPRFLLQEKFKYKGNNIDKMEYIADFKYIRVSDNKTIIEDVKGYKTEVYRIKKKLLLFKYDIEFYET